MREPVTLVYAVAFISFVVWKYFGGGFDLAMSAILVTGSVLATLNPQRRVTLKEMADTFETGVKYALAVGAASAAVGIVIGVINTTGVGFRIGFMVTQAASNLGSDHEQ